MADLSLEEEAVLKVVDTFLMAVGNGDCELQKSVALADGGLAIYRTNDGFPGPIRRMPASDFQKPTPNHDPFVEMYWAPRVDLRGSFAQVWSRYVLTDNGAIVHCGINAFQLTKLQGAWRIHSALSSMGPDACDQLGAKNAQDLRPRDGWRETRSRVADQIAAPRVTSKAGVTQPGLQTRRLSAPSPAQGRFSAALGSADGRDRTRHHP